MQNGEAVVHPRVAACRGGGWVLGSAVALDGTAAPARRASWRKQGKSFTTPTRVTTRTVTLRSASRHSRPRTRGSLTVLAARPSQVWSKAESPHHKMHQRSERRRLGFGGCKHGVKVWRLGWRSPRWRNSILDLGSGCICRDCVHVAAPPVAESGCRRTSVAACPATRLAPACHRHAACACVPRAPILDSRRARVSSEFKSCKLKEDRAECRRPIRRPSKLAGAG